MNIINALLNNPAGVVLPAGVILFLLLAIAWQQTGRFFVVGWLVRLLWLSVNLAAVPLWIAAVVLNIFLDMLRASYGVLRATVILILAFNVVVYLENPDGLYFTVPPTLIIFYLLKFGVNEERVKGWIFYSPKPRKIPAPRPKPLREKGKKAQKAAPTAAEKGREALQPQAVRIVVKRTKETKREADIIALLPAHLRNLIRGTL